MMAEPAAALGIPLRLLAEAPGVSAAQVISDHTVGDYTDLATLQALVKGCEVVTFDHEHVPTHHLHALEDDGVLVRPGPEALVHAQDKVVMRQALDGIGAPTPRHRVVTDAAEVAAFGFPCVLKTSRGGYDGKGVWFVSAPEECAEAFETAARSGVRILAEEQVDFRRELSALVARAPSGQAAAYPVVESLQRDGICSRGDRARPRPGLRPRDRRRGARAADRRRAGRDRNAGRRAVRDRGRARAGQRARHATRTTPATGPRTAPSPRSSRTTCGRSSTFRSAHPHRARRWTVMVNILGGPTDSGGRLYDGYPHALARDPRLRVHLYGKDPRPGRKVGHVNAYGDDLQECLERARHAAAWFAGDLGDESE